MSSRKLTMTLCALLIPVSASMADDQETQLLHTNPYQSFQNGNCTAPGTCAVLFPTTTHVTTAITNASCYVLVPSGTSILWVRVTNQAANLGFMVQPFYYGYSAGSVSYGINAAINVFAARGDQPRIEINTAPGTISELQCTLTGYHS